MFHFEKITYLYYNIVCIHPYLIVLTFMGGISLIVYNEKKEIEIFSNN